jgi:alpha-mannosidase
MNNYWETNYKAGQEGPTTFRYSIRPHGKYCPAAAAQFGIERSQPLVAVPVNPESQPQQSLLRIDGDGVILTSLKPTTDGKAWIVRLFNTGDKPERTTLCWRDRVPRQLDLCDLAEQVVAKAPQTIEMAPRQIVTLRATLPER